MAEYLNNEDHLNYGVKPTGVLPTMHDIIKLKKTYEGLIFTPLDKNAGCMFLCCPCYYENALRSTFTENKAYCHSQAGCRTPAKMRGTNKHEKIKRTPANAILDKWERHYDKMNYSKWFRYKKRAASDDSKFPTGYLLPKNKDAKKFRPIVSYYTHPCRTGKAQ